MSQYRDDEVLDAVVKGLKKLRTELRITMEDVYNDTGLNISRIEGGKANITISTLRKLCNYYQLPLYKFFKDYCDNAL
ncbi:MAG: helix-turn-helix transcriptional regulator [Bacteroidetes bacterium]|nr:MAG: helix-turn-helix transcriptional regulator [Bacteroidota bacterium]